MMWVRGSLKNLVQQAKYDLAVLPAMAVSVHDAAALRHYLDKIFERAR